MVYKSEVVKNDLSPSWKPFKVGIKQLSGETGKFRVKVIDYEDGGGDEIGENVVEL